ncbi:hypothetical protein M0R45_008613 [Rubus argutus]|uniref:Uncharacterized protein n=1 Tax=Rubus argutus TaxID=59490 RepID=A0AAW1Y1U6_RUBAR
MVADLSVLDFAQIVEKLDVSWRQRDNDDGVGSGLGTESCGQIAVGLGSVSQKVAEQGGGCGQIGDGCVGATWRSREGQRCGSYKWVRWKHDRGQRDDGLNGDTGWTLGSSLKIGEMVAESTG